MTINLHLPSKTESLRPSITVIGVGGAGGNAVNNMISANLEGVNFVVANTDAQALEHSLAERRIQLGNSITRGLGAGAMPEVGRAAAEEALDEIESYIEGSNMVFIAAGMGGGTGTGAAPVVARMAKERGILTVGIVTKPFQFEGLHRMRLADQGVQELQSYVDTLIVIPNQNLFRIINERTPFAEAFRMADEVLHSGVRGITDLIVMPGLINLDFADIRTVMREMGKAMMGTGEAEGTKRAIESAEAAIQNPLLDDFSMKGAKGVLINITGGYDMTLFEVDEAANRIRAEVDPSANIIFGATFNTNMEGRMRVSVVATGIESQAQLDGGQKTQTAVTQAVLDNRRAYAGSVGFGRAEQKVARPVPVPEAPREPSKAEARTSFFSEPVKFSAPLQQDIVIAPKATPVQMEPESRHESLQPVAEPAMQRVSGPIILSAPIAEAQPSLLPAQDEMLSFQQENELAYETSSAPVYNRVESQAAAVSSSGGTSFFQRMARVKDALTSPAVQQESHRAKPVERPRMELMKSEHVREEPVSGGRATVKQIKTTEDDYLDIPAFLRRQAN